MSRNIGILIELLLTFFFFFFFVALMEISHRQYLLRVIPLVLFDVLKGTIAMWLSCYGVEWSFSISVLTRVRFLLKPFRCSFEFMISFRRGLVIS